MVSATAILIVNYKVTTKSMDKMLYNFQLSLDTLSKETEKDIINMSRESARDLLKEIRIAVGGSLKPGESSKFMYLAEKQKELEVLKEFSYFGCQIPLCSRS